MTGAAGFAVTEVRCPGNRWHVLTTVYRAADGTLFAPGLPLDDSIRDAQCRKCGRSYPADTRAVRRAALEGQRNFALPL